MRRWFGMVSEWVMVLIAGVIGLAWTAQLAIGALGLAQVRTLQHGLDPHAPIPLGAVVISAPSPSAWITGWVSPNCPWCRRWWRDDLPALSRVLGARHVGLVLRPFPRSPGSLAAAAWLSCVPPGQRQADLNAFMTTPGLLARPEDWPGQSRALLACGLSQARQGRVLAQVKADRTTWNLAGTPIFLVGHTMVLGALSPARLRRLLP